MLCPPHAHQCPLTPIVPTLPPAGTSAYSPPDAFKISIPIRNNYMYARVRKALPELYAFTVCMWLRSRSGGTGQGTPFSYSVLGQANEIVLLEAGPDPMELLINDKVSGDGQATGMGTGVTLPGAPHCARPHTAGPFPFSHSAHAAHVPGLLPARLGSGAQARPG